MKIATIFYRYGTAKYADAEQRIRDLFRRRMPKVEREVVVVDGALPQGYEERTADNTTLLGGSTPFWEFGGVDVAVRWFGVRLWSFDLVHIATSAFFTCYTAYLERFDTQMLESIAGRPVCLGHIDCYNEPVRLLSYSSQHWIRTAFLFLPPAELLALSSFVSFSDSGRILSGNPRQPFRGDAPLSENYRDNISGWLSGQDIGQGDTWHSGFQLAKETLPEFERKTVSILNEHLLAIRLRALGCRLVDTTWLATELASGRDIRWSLGWRQQLAMRDVDSLLIAT